MAPPGPESAERIGDLPQGSLPPFAKLTTTSSTPSYGAPYPYPAPILGTGAVPSSNHPDCIITAGLTTTGSSGCLLHVTGSPSNPSGDHSSRGSSFWESRWALLGRPLEVAPTAPVAIALSGGADSVYLATMIARSEPRPRALAVHIDHGLRGEDSRSDAEFCARLCAKLGLPFARRVVEIDPEGSDLEARARQARYRALAEEASNAGISVLLTGHHEDDAVETLLMRWMRGTDLQGLAGLRRETILGPGAFSSETERPLRVVRPLIGMRREEVRSTLRNHGIDWREDLSNTSAAFSRNRVRSRVLPEIAAQCGDEGVDNLRAFAKAVESFEDELADRTAHITWEPVAFEAARRSASMPDLGGTVRRGALDDLSPTLMKRALGRLIGEGTGRRPARDFLQNVAEDLSEGRNGRREVHDGWTLQVQSDALHLTPPPALLSGPSAGPSAGGSASGGSGAAVAEPQVGQALAEAPAAAPTGTPTAAAAAQRQRKPMAAQAARAGVDDALEPAPAPKASAPQASAQPAAQPKANEPASPMGALALGVPGAVQLPDGRSIHATAAGSADTQDAATSVVIDGAGLQRLEVRFARPGDRFQGLGAPGHKPLRRFLSDIGIPREERGLVPLVVAPDSGEIVWVAGVRIAETRKLREGSTSRLKLTLEGVRER